MSDGPDEGVHFPMDPGERGCTGPASRRHLAGLIRSLGKRAVVAQVMMGARGICALGIHA